MLWKGLGVVTNTESPIVVVLRCVLFLILSPLDCGLMVWWCSGSMEPAFYRGDLLFLTNPVGERYRTGDITVYNAPGQAIPIVHRILETHDMKHRYACGYFVLRSLYLF